MDRYEEALEKARQGKPIEEVFPELKESEDERTRIEMIGMIKACTNWVHKKEYITYLERQKEQKPYYSPLCNTIKDKIREYIANHFIADTVVKTDMKSIVKAMEEGVRLGKEEQKPIFRIGDDIIEKDGTCCTPKAPFHIERIEDDCYWDGNDSILICNQDDFQLTERHPAEWSEEDERIRKHIIDIIKDNAKSKCIPCDAEIAYLERQKEQKPVEWSEEDEDYLMDVKSAINHYFDEGYAEELCTWLKSLHERFNLQPKQEWDEEDEEMLLSAIEYVQTYPAHRQSVVNWLKSLLERFYPQPKQEWSKEDDAAHTRILGAIAKAFMGVLPIKPSEEDVHWLKTLPERFNIQPKQEWSEEDKHILKNVHDFIKESTIDPNRVNCAEECLNWLNSLPERFNLQPKEKWSEEDEEMCQNILECLRNGWRKLHADILKYESWLKSLHPQPHWKPSEEQMDALARATNRCIGVDDAKILVKLLEQLEKL